MGCTAARIAASDLINDYRHVMSGFPLIYISKQAIFRSFLV